MLPKKGVKTAKLWVVAAVLQPLEIAEGSKRMSVFFNSEAFKVNMRKDGAEIWRLPRCFRQLVRSTSSAVKADIGSETWENCFTSIANM